MKKVLGAMVFGLFVIMATGTASAQTLDYQKLVGSWERHWKSGRSTLTIESVSSTNEVITLESFYNSCSPKCAEGKGNKMTGTIDLKKPNEIVFTQGTYKLDLSWRGSGTMSGFATSSSRSPVEFVKMR